MVLVLKLGTLAMALLSERHYTRHLFGALPLLQLQRQHHYHHQHQQNELMLELLHHHQL